MRLATWNVNSLRARMPRVQEWIGSRSPDVLCMQETKLKADAFPVDEFAEMGYEVAHHGEGQWNGVAIASRVGLHDVVAGFADSDPEDPQARLIRATCDGVRVACVYVPNGREVGSEHYEYKLSWFDRLGRAIASECTPSDKLVVCGDFNVAPDDRDVWDPRHFVGSTHVSEPERRALCSLVEWGLVDVFRRHHDDGGLFSWWDYRGGSFHKGHGMRIDLVMTTEPVARAVTEIAVDRDARKGTKPSDHAPVVAEIEV